VLPADLAVFVAVAVIEAGLLDRRHGASLLLVNLDATFLGGNFAHRSHPNALIDINVIGGSDEARDTHRFRK
jgi:hypothetical protein